ncbi:hypothetical protein SLEP1_g46943 [Rubroshorea leprosula]|uniref:Matrin-type domain-containing protein n=1 Tax=Rubroshorea leprosula TaxID=152421 RepID=A0AAV5LNV2_9ROSI|nr:hypothetical protein SLEP1_g46943 [Rubroshorea leprosula]
MASTLLEMTRAAHEEVERLERLIVKDLRKGLPTTSKDRLFQGHRLRNMIDTITSTTEKLIETYHDNDNAMKEEIVELGTNVFGGFYGRLKEIREYHRKHPPAAGVVDVNVEYEELPVIEFTGEEAFGRCLDLHELYNQYINLKLGDPIEYSAYLDVFPQTQNIPRKLKLTRQYREYMENLLEYLIYFFQRTEPLQDLDRIFAKVVSEFELQGNEMYFGSQSLKDIGLMEAKMKKLCDLLSQTIEQTKQNLVKKQALTYEEMERDREEEEKQVDTESDDEEQQIYNPLKLPMGWDGKPIPFWLYKLHGLGREFKCEICGDYSYWGRRAFERHFQESRHQSGMRSLNIPNTKNFNEITPIQEAQALWEHIQEQQGQNNWHQDFEEFEDTDGNIYNKRTFTDLQRQGLI